MQDSGPCWLPILGPGGAHELGETGPVWVGGVGALWASPGRFPAPGHHKVMEGSSRNHHWVVVGYGCSWSQALHQPSRPFSQDGYPLGLPRFCGDRRQTSRGHQPPGTPGADCWATHPAPGAQSSETEQGLGGGAGGTSQGPSLLTSVSPA